MDTPLPAIVAEQKDDVLRIIGTHLDLSTHRVFVFGSHIARTARNGSDIDIGLEGPAPIPFEVLGAIRTDLEALPTLRAFDLVDFKTVSPEFRTVAEEHLVLLH